MGVSANQDGTYCPEVCDPVGSVEPHLPVPEKIKGLSEPKGIDLVVVGLRDER